MSLSQTEIDEAIEELIELNDISDNAKSFLKIIKDFRHIAEDISVDNLLEDFYPEDEEFNIEDDPFAIDEIKYGVDDYGYDPDDSYFEN